MSFNVKGITFSKDDLIEIPISQLKVNSLSPAHLFTFIADKPFMLLRAGDFIEASFIQKYADKKLESFYALVVIETKSFTKYHDLIEELVKTQNFKKKIPLKDKLLKDLGSDFYLGLNKLSYLNFVTACFSLFYKAGEETLIAYQNSSEILFRRALISSANTVIAAIANNYLEKEFLYDLYNATFLMDYGLVHQQCNYTLITACENERLRPGSGLSYMHNMSRSSDEVKVYTDHPLASYQYAKSLSNVFHSLDAIHAIKIHHERSDGTGFPNGYIASEISYWETLMQFGDQMTPFDYCYFHSADAKELFHKPLEDLRVRVKDFMLPVEKVLNHLYMYMSWAQSLKEVS